MKHPFYILIIILVLNSTICYADLNTTPQIGKIYNKEGRAAYAVKLKSFFTGIDEYVPSLSPSQKDWIDAERKAYRETNNYNQFSEVTKPKEFDIDNVKNMHVHLFNLLNLVIANPEGELEILLWTEIALQIWDLGYWTSIVSLGDRGIIDKKFFGMTYWSHNSVYMNNGLLPFKQIIQHIVRPYLVDELPK